MSVASTPPITRAEQIVAQMPQPPTISEGRSTRACYRRQSDSIEMPAFARFHSPEEFHLTLFHELIHSTGHESRLARKGVTESDGFGGKTYSQEELVAEMGAAFLGMEAEIVRDQHEQSPGPRQARLYRTSRYDSFDHQRTGGRGSSRAEI